MKNTVIILGAGKGTRMKKDLNKQYLMLKNKPILAQTIEVFEKCPYIDEIILVINENDYELYKKNILRKYKFKKIVKTINGGEERQNSVYNGLLAIHKDTEIVIIHDGARPLVTSSVIEKCIKNAAEYGAVSTGVPIKETIKIITEHNYVDHTPQREKVWITQTPQAFKTKIIKEAHEKAIEDQMLGTDDAMLVERMGLKVKMVESDYENIKITTPEDLITAEAILNHRSEQ